jgi:hypothetical protein
MRSLVSLVMAIVLTAAGVGVLYWGYQRMSENRAEIAETREILMATLNREFRKPQYKFDDLLDMNLPGTSMLTGVPDDLFFKEFAYETDRTGKRYCKAVVEGTFHRSEDKVDLTVNFIQDGRKMVTITLDAVPPGETAGEQ